MPAIGESRQARRERLERQRSQFPELNSTSLDTLARVDALRRTEGRPLTSFGQAAEDALINSYGADVDAAPNVRGWEPGPLGKALRTQPTSSYEEMQQGRREAELLRSGALTLDAPAAPEPTGFDRVAQKAPGALNYWLRHPWGDQNPEEREAFLRENTVTDSKGRRVQTVTPDTIREAINVGSMVAGNAPDLTVPKPAAQAAAGAAQSVSHRLFGLEAPKRALSKADEALNAIKRTVGIGVPEDDIATPIMRQRKQAQQVVESQAARLGAVADETTRAFKMDKKGRISSLPGAPTIQDIAAKLPMYDQYLDDAQKAALTRLRSEIEPYTQALKENGVEVASRADVMDGGFYLPRGRAAEEGADIPLKVGTGRGGAGGKKGFERGAVFDSMAEGIDAGYEYARFRDAIQSYGQDAGSRTIDKWAADSFKATGLGETASERLLRQEPALAAKKAALDKSLSRFRSLADRLGDTEQARIEEFLSNPAAFDPDDLRDFLDVVNAQGTVNRAQARRALADTRAALRDLAPDWRRAMDRARQTPRDQGSIGFSTLNGTTFPDEIANVANKYLNAEKKATGFASGTINTWSATNNFMRMLKATGDVSGLGIQMLLGAASHPIAYGRAAAVSLRALGDERAFSSFLRNFDDAAHAAGRPDSRAWAALGGRIGGSATEFTGGVGLGKVPDLIQKAPLIKQSNRSFGAGGDALRLLVNDAIYSARTKGGQKLSDDAMREIAHFGNLMTGWANWRVGGQFGQLTEFAPRYFASQLEIAARGLAGRGIVADEARKSFAKLIGAGALITVAANEARGKDTEWIPGRPNFMRIRDVAGQDISVFGPWDSLVRGIAHTATGDKTYFLRTKASPSVALAWDYLSGKDFLGNETRDSEGTPNIEWLWRNLLPFSVSDVGNEPIASTLIGATGVKATPLSPTDRVEAGQYDQLSGDKQFRATRAQAWKAIQDQAPEEIKGQLAGKDSYYDWLDSLREEYTKAATAEAKQKGIPPDTVPAAVDRAINRHPVVKAMAKAVTHYENEWIEKNPEDAYKLWKKFEGKSYREDGYWQPTKKQAEAILKLTGRAKKD